MAIAYYHHNDFAYALQSIDEAIRLKEDYVDGYNFKAWIYATTDQREKALDVIEKSINLEPNNSQSLLIYSYILYFLNKYDKSLEMINRSISRNSKEKESWYLKGRLLIRQDEIDDAERCFIKAIKIDEKLAKAQNDKAYLLSRKSDQIGALSEIKKAVKNEPSSATYQQNLIKLTVLKETKPTISFVDFWSSTTSKKIIAIFLISAAILIFTPIWSGLYFINTTIFPGNSPANSSGVTQSRLSIISNIPESNMVVLALIVLIFVFPQIKSGKIGPLEFTLSEPSGPNIYSSLELADISPKYEGVESTGPSGGPAGPLTFLGE